jgi:SAM-dependent methyltransferase
MRQKYDNSQFLDLMGKAILDFQTGNDPEDITTETSISEPELLAVSYLFRSHAEMPAIEQTALSLAKGRVLDVGCGAGSHSLHLIGKGLEVLPIDVSPNAIQACRLRGLHNARIEDVMECADGKFDTILLLMNGTGICGKLENLPIFLRHLKSLLALDGQILIDSSDIRYMYEDDEDGSIWVPANTDYYGELTFDLTYKGQREKPFQWLYVDARTFAEVSEAEGFAFEKIRDGEHYDYLARLTLK